MPKNKVFKYFSLSLIILLAAFSVFSLTFRISHLRAQDSLDGIDAGDGSGDQGDAGGKGDADGGKGDEGSGQNELDQNEANTTYYHTTFAWSSNIGWINASSSNYAVLVDSSGNFNGYAWANPKDSLANTNNIGWLNFSGVSAPVGGGAVTGQATFLSHDNRDWDGIVKFNCTTCDVQYNPNDGGGPTLTGWAWGGPSVVGWIHFDHTRIGGGAPVSLSASCDVSPRPYNTGQSITWTASVSGGSGTYSTYAWTGFAPNNPPNPPSNPVTSRSFANPTTVNAHVTVTDSVGTSAGADCPAVVVSNNSLIPPTLHATSLGAGGAGSCNPGILLSWNSAGAGIQYRLYKSNSPGVDTNNPLNQIGSGNLAGTIYVDHDILAGNTYYYKIVATDGTIDSVPSNEASATYNYPASCVLTDNVHLEARPNTAPLGGVCTLYYDISGSDDCTLSSPSGDRKFNPPMAIQNSPQGVSGSTDTSPILQTQTYNLTCGSITSTAKCTLHKIKEF